MCSSTENDSDETQLSEKYISELHKTVANFDRNRFMVKRELRYVTEYSNKSRWDNLSKSDIQDISVHLAPLVLPLSEDDELARRFDLLMLGYQLAILAGSTNTAKYINRITSSAKALSKKTNIPAIGQQINLLNELQTDQFWQAVNLKRLEEVRNNLRDLIKFLDKTDQPSVFTHFQDEIKVDEITVRDVVTQYTTLQSYKDRVESYIRNNKLHMTIHKINTNRQITIDDLNELERILFDGKERGTKEDYIREYGDQPLGKFIRSIIGLDIQAANEAFAYFLQAGNLKADQMTFINNIINYLTKNGTIERRMLFEPPFTNINDQGLMGVFQEGDAFKVLNIVDKVNQTASIA